MAIRGILNISQMGLSEKYLTFDDEHKYKLCKEVIAKAFQNMQIEASKDERKKVMDAVLSNSIHHYENLELYEDCQVLADLREVLYKEF